MASTLRSTRSPMKGRSRPPADARLKDSALSRSNFVDIDLVDEPAPVKLSIAMPAHNESKTIAAAIDDVLGAHLPAPYELIIVDDGSSDATSEIIGTYDDPHIITRRHPTNLGKGAAVMTASALATGSHLVIFDADCEYRAQDLSRLLDPVTAGVADIVFGVRLFGMNTVYQSYRYAMGNRVTTLVANVIFDAYLSDLHSCLKLIPLPLFRRLTLTKNGFGLDSEITAELLRRGYRPFEVPVSYVSRSHAEGKKLTWRDGLDCLAVLGKVRLRGRASRGAKIVPSTVPAPVLGRAAAVAGTGPAPVLPMPERSRLQLVPGGNQLVEVESLGTAQEC